ncbi:hypothetical protein EI94DRAFT_1701343 [Lactarius quietus]|nr:hypothetical protein EI94DRAFT_1701343 [Lactarius quietus]
MSVKKVGTDGTVVVRSSFCRLKAMERRSYSPPPLLPSEDLRPFPPTAIAESQWGEPHSEAFGTGVRIAGLAVNPSLTLLGGQVGEEENRAGWEWQTCHLLNLGCGRRSSCTLRLESMGRHSYPPPPLSPSDDLKPFPPTTIAESQWGEPHSEAFGIGARVAGSAVNPDLTPPGGKVGEEESGAGREWQTCHSSNPGRGGTLWLYVETILANPDHAFLRWCDDGQWRLRKCFKQNYSSRTFTLTSAYRTLLHIVQICVGGA